MLSIRNSSSDEQITYFHGKDGSSYVPKGGDFYLQVTGLSADNWHISVHPVDESDSPSGMHLPSITKDIAASKTSESNTGTNFAESKSANTTIFNVNDFSAITDAAAHNESRFKRDYKGKTFSATGSLKSVDEGSWLSGGKSQVNVRVGGFHITYCFTNLDFKQVADWPSNMPIKITGIIDDTVLGQLKLEECVLQPLP